MAEQLVKTDTLICTVARSTSPVVARATLSNPTAGGWTMFLDGTFKHGGNAPEDVDLGPGERLIGKVLEVSATMKNITGKPAPLSLKVDAATQSGTMQGEASAGRAAHYSIFVVFVEAT
ncbi:MAG TPA: hypothetical protein VGD80_16700 [Kofleriaceae bacterium]